MKMTEQPFGQDYHLITLENGQGVTLSVTDLGARIVSLKADSTELVLGFDSAGEYLEKDPYIGASIGRTAGRIENGRFTLGEKNYQAAVDPATGHTLHGGSPGFETKKWSYVLLNGENEASVLFTTTSPDMEHGFPGTLDVEVRYTLTQDNIWRITTRGISDRETIFNPTNHVYFNLSGDVSQPVDQHELWVNSEKFAPLRSDSIPTGEQQEVAGTAFDFRETKKLATVFASDFEQKNLFDGVDHPFFLKEHRLDEPAACLTSPDKKVRIVLSTDASSVVIFTANFGKDTPVMHGKKLANHGGITFETQTAPGAEQYPGFGSIHLLPHVPFETTTEFKIETREDF
ncbi:galactose-1-epimerase [Enterococcus sp. ZJ1668]|uniref:galactose-1-epimerase n=1 Tax=Enterococcus sp. ZJ1668 TaxID=2709402 RepID=UPI0013ECDB33|nr:galactose-1-epimerase [Enterococcus sp. ZJ1668]